MSLPSLSSNPILDPEDKADLERQGLLLRSPDGHFRIHKRRLHKYSDIEYQSMPLPTPPSSSVSQEPIPPDHFATIPDFFISRETIIYVSFDDNTASTIWDRWTQRGDDGGPMTFENMLLEYIQSQANDIWSEVDSDWYDTMTSFGISKELREATMDPEFKDIRLTQTLKEWLLDTISAQYQCLELIQSASSERARAARRGEGRLGGT